MDFGGTYESGAYNRGFNSFCSIGFCYGNDKGFIMSGTLIARGAFGRVADKADWDSGKDFKSEWGPYFSVRDCDFLRNQKVHTIVFLDNHGRQVWQEHLDTAWI